MTTTPISTNHARTQYPRDHFEDPQWRMSGIYGAPTGSAQSVIMELMGRGIPYSTLLATFGGAAASVAAILAVEWLDKYYGERLFEMYGPESQWAYKFKPIIQQNGNIIEISTDQGKTFEPISVNNTIIDNEILKGYVDMVISENLPAEKPTPIINTPVGNETIQLDQTRPNKTDITLNIGTSTRPGSVTKDQPDTSIGLAGQFPQTYRNSPFVGDKTGQLIPTPDFVNGISLESPANIDYISPTLDNLVGRDKIVLENQFGLESDIISQADLPKINPTTIIPTLIAPGT